MNRQFQFLFILFISIPAVGQSSQETHEEQVKDLIIDSFQDVFSDLDREKMDEYYTRNFLLLEDGEVWDYQKLTDYVMRAKEQGRQAVRVNSFDFVKVEIRNDMAWVAYFNNAAFLVEGEAVGEMNWLESATAIKTDAGWKLQMLHSTVIENKE